MTAKEKFLTNARNNGLDVEVTETTLKWTTLNNKMIVIMVFDKEGNFKKSEHIEI